MAFGFLHYSMLCLLITLQARLLHLFWLVCLFFATVNFSFLKEQSSLIFFVTTVHVATLGEALCPLFGQNDEHLMMVSPKLASVTGVKVVVIPSLLYHQTLLKQRKKTYFLVGFSFIIDKQTDIRVLQGSFIVFLLCGSYHRTVVTYVLCVMLRAAAAVGC